MKFFKAKKHSILLNILRYSFVGVFIFAISMSSFFSSNLVNITKASGETLTVVSTTSNSVTLNATGLVVGSTYRINVFNTGNVLKTHWDLNTVATSTVTTTSPSIPPLTPDTYVAKISNGANYIATSANFTILPPNAPQISSFSPKWGTVGDTVTIIGTNFNGVTGVLFNSTNAVTATNTPTQITVKVPIGAPSGKLTVKTPNGNAVTTEDFNVGVGWGNGVSNITTSNLTQTSVVLKSTGLDDPSSSYSYKLTNKKDNSSSKMSILSGDIDDNDIATNNITGLSSNTLYGVELIRSNPTDTVIATTSFTTLVNGNGGGTTTFDPSKVKFNGIVPVCNTGEIDPVTKNYKNACDFNMVMTLINTVINFLLVTMATPLFALIIIYVGWLYLSDMGSAENIKKAKSILKNAVIGYVIALAAWLIVKTILVTVGFNPKDAYLAV